MTNERALWLVSKGNRTVGPVPTELLLRGIAAGKVDEECWVQQEDWGAPRRLDEVRETAGLLGRMSSPTPSSPFGSAGLRSHDWFASATDPSELLHFAMGAAVAATHAPLGLTHIVREPMRLPVTSCAHGRVSEDVFGTVIPEEDPVVEAARYGTVVAGGVDSTLTRTIAARFVVRGRPLEQIHGVAMMPIVAQRLLLGFVELARTDHPFRKSDESLLNQLAFSAALSL